MAEIDIANNGNMYSFTGSAVNKTASNQSLRYVLSVIKSDSQNSNNVKNDQTGRFVLELGEKKNLSSATINVADEDRVIILLLIYDEEDTPLGMDRIVINENEEDKSIERKYSTEKKSEVKLSPDAVRTKADGVVLRGIVTEDTKTKPGSDFYKMFYSSYLANNVNGEEIVNIKEVLSLNNNTKIEITVANEMVLEFFVRPQNDYLKAMADVALKRVYWFLQKYKKSKNVLKYY
ncbi:CsgE family curli-type amyloid fiber assembly protein [Aequorivita marina]|uniref:CsgE family curli-type amyloid fiber assembly protein n=1 Tax=Aequorivita marina TaxID=3073654 RepID=UPI0028762836|nr:CsgE family curli-type amyloid fiber assembly protein [Aequorivita sp. S2608]MDS1299314.1 CsgE family curli-type amyloid fiber assembly protein [Aequorivita sp. S2608]